MEDGQVTSIPWNVTPYALPLAQYGLWNPPPKKTRKKPPDRTWAKVVGAL